MLQIELSHNNLGAEGAEALAPAISVSASLTSIDLSRNSLTNYGKDMSGVKAIADALRVSASLTQVLAFLLAIC